MYYALALNLRQAKKRQSRMLSEFFSSVGVVVCVGFLRERAKYHTDSVFSEVFFSKSWLVVDNMTEQGSDNLDRPRNRVAEEPTPSSVP